MIYDFQQGLALLVLPQKSVHSLKFGLTLGRVEFGIVASGIKDLSSFL